MEELNNLCGSDSLSLTALREKVSQLPSAGDIEEAYGEYPYLHSICMNKNVTLDMVKYVLDKLPDLISWDTHAFDDKFAFGAYALHCACHNEHCPSSVIVLILKEHTSPPVAKISKIKSKLHKWGVMGLPLHHYLSRTCNIDIDIVKILVEANPQSMLGADGSVTPLHIILYNQSANNLQDILGCLLKLSPLSIRVLDGDGNTPLQLASYHEHITLEVVQMLYNAWPEALRMGDIDGYLPIHQLCRNRKLEESVALSVLRFMLDIDPTLVRERNVSGLLPIHFAVCKMSTGFCKVLIDLYPESIRVGRTNDGRLPIHMTCRNGNGGADIIHYLLELYPESINVRDGEGDLPVHGAARLGRTDIIELLLKLDPDLVSKTTNNARHLPLHLACYYGRIEVAQVLYDALPEAILVRNGHEKIPIQVVSNHLRNSSTIVNFLQAQQAYAQKAKDMTTMTTPDANGWLPLHHAMKDNAPLGSIKLLVKGNPLAIRTADSRMVFPLHIACEFSSVKVIRHLVELDSRFLVSQLDMNNDSILHFACRGGNCEVIKYLVDSHGSLVSDTNADNELPFHLLLECEDEQVRESLEFTEVCFRLLQAYPETVTMQTSRKRRRD